jgi:hypothetical protein
MKLTKEQSEFLKPLKEWIQSYPMEKEWIIEGRLRDRGFYMELCFKVQLLGGYTQIDREWLRRITEEYYKENKPNG